MDEEEYEIGEEWDVDHPSRRARPKVDFLILGLNLIGGIATAIRDTAEIAVNICAAHANWQVERDVFHEEAAIEIETLTTGDEE